MSISVHRSADVAVIMVAGDVDLSTAPLLEDQISDVIAGGGLSLVEVDLAQVPFLDSSGIAVLLNGRRRADEHGVSYRVVRANGIPRTVLEITGVWEHLCGRADLTSGTGT